MAVGTNLTADLRHNGGDVGGAAVLEDVLYDIIAVLVLHKAVHVLSSA
jgi:hypothetical protein